MKDDKGVFLAGLAARCASRPRVGPEKRKRGYPEAVGANTIPRCMQTAHRDDQETAVTTSSAGHARRMKRCFDLSVQQNKNR